MFPFKVIPKQDNDDSKLSRKINSEKDAIYFKTKSPAYSNIVRYVDLLCESIEGTGSEIINNKYSLKSDIFKKCSDFLGVLERTCDDTDLNLARDASTLRFGHVAFREWFDNMKSLCREFILKLPEFSSNQYKEELLTYLTESFGNRMRIDYGTGHELSFIIFTMGLCNFDQDVGGDNSSLIVTPEKLKAFVSTHGSDIHSLFAHRYLRLCRRVQAKFRLEPAGSRGVYNMDDFQFLPFLFGSAQLSGKKYVNVDNFYQPEEVEQYKNDYILFEAVDFILNNKRGPFNEHSYTLWGFTNLGSWSNIFRKIRMKFIDEVLRPLPIIQHFLFGEYILRWECEQNTAS